MRSFFFCVSYSILLLFSDTQEGRTEMDRLLVRSRFRNRTFARRGPRTTADYHGILLHQHLLGDLARYEAPVSHDVATCVSLRFHFLFRPVN